MEIQLRYWHEEDSSSMNASRYTVVTCRLEHVTYLSSWPACESAMHVILLDKPVGIRVASRVMVTPNSRASVVLPMRDSRSHLPTYVGDVTWRRKWIRIVESSLCVIRGHFVTREGCCVVRYDSSPLFVSKSLIRQIPGCGRRSREFLSRGLDFHSFCTHFTPIGQSCCIYEIINC